MSRTASVAYRSMQKSGDETQVVIPIHTTESLDTNVAASEEATSEVVLAEEAKVYEDFKTIPVSVALGVTIGWIFFCAGLFCIWEKNWSYWKAVYFIFISFR